jgi:hypothetical protein
MRFDQFERSYEDVLHEEASKTESAREPVPDGTHDFEIRRVRFVEKLGKIVMDFATASGTYEFVPLWLDPKNEDDHDKAMTILHLLELPPDTEFTDKLEGRFLSLRTKRHVKNGEQQFDNKGKPKVFINGIERSKLEVPTSKPEHKPQTAAARVAAARGDEAGGEDDIPF